jgi:hypothetical protein
MDSYLSISQRWNAILFIADALTASCYEHTHRSYLFFANCGICWHQNMKVHSRDALRDLSTNFKELSLYLLHAKVLFQTFVCFFDILILLQSTVLIKCGNWVFLLKTASTSWCNYPITTTLFKILLYWDIFHLDLQNWSSFPGMSCQ